MLRKIGLVVFITTLVMACGGNGDDIVDPGGVNDDFDRGALLVHIADNIIVPAFEDFQTKVQDLETKASNFTTTPSLAALEDVQDSWLTAYKTWQYVEMFNIGKAEEIVFANRVNIYPVSTADIELNVDSGSYDLSNPSNFDAQGFPALDYLLYGLADTNEDLITVYTSAENAEGYKNYLIDVITTIADLTELVVNDWNTTYRDEFVASAGNTATSSLNLLVNDFIFYYEKGFRANKFGIPAGNFSTEPLPEKVEAFYHKELSKELAIEGFTAIENFFEGKAYNTASAALGFDDYLEDLERGDLVTQISSQFNSAKSSINGLDANFYQQIIDDNTQMTMTYDEIQVAVPLLKVDMVAAFNVSIDFVDADGD